MLPLSSPSPMVCILNDASTSPSTMQSPSLGFICPAVSMNYDAFLSVSVLGGSPIPCFVDPPVFKFILETRSCLLVLTAELTLSGLFLPALVSFALLCTSPIGSCIASTFSLFFLALVDFLGLFRPNIYRFYSGLPRMHTSANAISVLSQD